MTELKSREAQFLYGLFDVQELPKNPFLVIFIGQLKKLTTLIDENPEYQKMVSKIFMYIKENW